MVFLKHIKNGVERAIVFTVTRVTRIGNRIMHEYCIYRLNQWS